MASSTIAIPTTYHKQTGLLKKQKNESENVRSEDELLKFFLHGSYDVQRGTNDVSTVDEDIPDVHTTEDDSTTNKTTNNDDKKNKSRFMFEETYMINISVKQPDALPTSKQIDVRIERTPSDPTNVNNDKIDDDEVSSIFDEDENDDIDSVVFNEIPPSVAERPSTPLTLADMISKTLTTIPTAPNKETNPQPWFVDKSTDENKTKEKQRSKSTTKTTTTLTANRAEDEKLIQYLDYLETKEDVNVKPTTPAETKKTLSDPFPIIDLEQLCRSLTVSDLKDEIVRKKIHELKLLIDDRHKKVQNQTPSVKSRKENLPILIALPASREQNHHHNHQQHQQRHHLHHHQQHQQQRQDIRRTTNVPSSTLLQSKTVNNFQKTSVPSFHQMISNVKASATSSSGTTPMNGVVYGRRVVQQFPATNNVNRKFQFT